MLAPFIACQKDDGATGLASALDEAEIVVAAAEPDTVTVDTTVTVRITGSGFTDSSTASWLIDSATVAPGILTLATTYKSPTELEARIAVSPDAALRDYSIRVRSKKGKQGIGVERFRVVAKPIALPEPGVTSEARDVNDHGVIIGHAFDASFKSLAVRWTLADTGWMYTVLGPGYAVAVNNDGLIVRQAYDDAILAFRSWIHFPSGAMVDLGQITVYGISNNGTLFGTVRDSTQRSTWVVRRQISAASWSAAEQLPPLPAYTGMGFYDINSAGDIVGWVGTSTTSAGVVWRYRDGKWQTPEVIDREASAGASAINDAGTLVGWMWPCIPGSPTCESSPAFWPFLGGPRKVLPTLYNTLGWATGINNSNQIVGSALVHYNDGSGPVAALVQHAVIWFPGGEWPEDLGAIRPWQWGEAQAINNYGLIVGHTNDAQQREHAAAWQLPRTAPQLPRVSSRSR